MLTALASEASQMPFDFPSGVPAGTSIVNGDATYVFDGTVWASGNAGNQPIVPEAPADGQDYGRRGSDASWQPVLPLAGGTMTGLTTFYQFDTNGPITQVVYPVGNSTATISWDAQVVMQGQSNQDRTKAEFTAIFGNYIVAGQPDGQKGALYAGVVQGPNAGAGWALNTLIARNATSLHVPGTPDVGSGSPGTPGACLAKSTIGYELDFTNWDQDCSAGVGPFTVGMYISCASSYRSLAAIYMDGNAEATGTYLWDNGIFFADSMNITGRLIRSNTIFDSTHSAYSYHDQGTHSGASYYAADTSPVALAIAGNHANSGSHSSHSDHRDLENSGSELSDSENSEPENSESVKSGSGQPASSSQAASES